MAFIDECTAFWKVWHGGNILSKEKQEDKEMYSLDEVKKVDPEIAQAIVDEQERQNSHIERKDIPERDITADASV